MFSKTMPSSYISMFLIFCFITTPVLTSPTDLKQSSFLYVPNSQFSSSVKTAIKALQSAASSISRLSSKSNDFRLSNAISDCLELFDLSADELSWTLATSENPEGKIYGTGNLSADIGTWLSATLTNQYTCLDGLLDTNNCFGKKMDINQNEIKAINQVTIIIQHLLSMVRLVDPVRANSKFQSWVNTEDKKLVLGKVLRPVNVTVALDGSGNYTSLMAAILAAPDHSKQRYVIYVKKGKYYEYVEIKKNKINLMIIGDGMDATIISGNRSCVDGYETFKSATFDVSGQGFIAVDMSFENTAGPQKKQAVAFISKSDCSVLFHCRFDAYQDTLYAHSSRQFYLECEIKGTIDFIFGDASAIFQRCVILAKQGLPTSKNAITAQGRYNHTSQTGFSIQFCNISANWDLLTSANPTPTYLGRPWKPYSRTVVMKSYISNVIQPDGWFPWDDTGSLDKLYYGEYMNTGPGAAVTGRVNWPGFRIIKNSSEAEKFTVANFINGDDWLPSTGVNYTSGLDP